MKMECKDTAAMLRQAVNSRIQGSASDVIKQSMLAVQRVLQTRQGETREEGFPWGRVLLSVFVGEIKAAAF